MSASRVIACATFSSRVRSARAGVPTISELSGNSLPSVPTAPASTRQFFPILAPLSTTAPMPIRLFRAMVQPCKTTLWPMTQSSPILRGKPRSVCSTALSWSCEPPADLDPLIVAAQHGVEPDAGVGLEAHAPDHDGAVGDPIAAVGWQVRRLAIKLEDRHRRPSSLGGATLPRRT